MVIMLCLIGVFFLSIYRLSQNHITGIMSHVSCIILWGTIWFPPLVHILCSQLITPFYSAHQPLIAPSDYSTSTLALQPLLAILFHLWSRCIVIPIHRLRPILTARQSNFPTCFFVLAESPTYQLAYLQPPCQPQCLTCKKKKKEKKRLK